MDIAPDALDLMTRTLLGEADQTPEGWQALANIIKNRVNSRAWGPNTRVGPVLNANKQFSVWNNTPKMQALAARVRATPTSDPNYQRAATVLQQVFNDQLPDNTGGATHYYAPKQMPNGQAPDWALGEQGRMIGSQIFYRLPLTAKNTENTILPTASPSSGGLESVGAGNGFAYGGESPQDQGVDLRHLEPVFRARIDKLQADAAAAGIKTHLTDGYRDNKSQAADYAKLGALGLAAMPGSSYHQFGRAVDLVADNPAQQQALIALADEPGRGITAGAHFQTPDRVHFQAAEGKVAPLVGPGEAAPARPAGQGGIGSDASAPLGTATGPPDVRTIVPNPANLPAPNAQTVSATAPGSSAGFAGPGSDKYSVIQRMTTGTDRNPELITAANWGHLGGAAPVAPPGASAAAAPAATPRPVLDVKDPPIPPERPADPPGPAPTVPPSAPVDLPPSAPLASVVPNWGAATPNAPTPVPANPNPTAPPRIPKVTPGAPSMGFPAVTNPFPPDQTSMNIPGSMLASAQNLINLLFPPSRIG
jgi:hypothetical protein